MTLREGEGCCSRLSALIEDDDVPVGYSPEDREWWLKLLNIDPERGSDWREPSALQLIAFCPFCGAELPKQLGTVWFDTLRGLGFDDPTRQDIPEEFQSDRWWKERGL